MRFITLHPAWQPSDERLIVSLISAVSRTSCKAMFHRTCRFHAAHVDRHPSDFREGCETPHNRHVHIPRILRGMGKHRFLSISHPSKKRQGWETGRMRQLPLLFRADSHEKGGAIVIFLPFHILLPEIIARKGGGNGQSRGFHIPQDFCRDVKVRENDSFTSLDDITAGREDVKPGKTGNLTSL